MFLLWLQLRWSIRLLLCFLFRGYLLQMEEMLFASYRIFRIRRISQGNLPYLICWEQLLRALSSTSVLWRVPSPWKKSSTPKLPSLVQSVGTHGLRRVQFLLTFSIAIARKKKLIKKLSRRARVDFLQKAVNRLEDIRTIVRNASNVQFVVMKQLGVMIYYAILLNTATNISNVHVANPSSISIIVVPMRRYALKLTESCSLKCHL